MTCCARATREPACSTKQINNRKTSICHLLQIHFLYIQHRPQRQLSHFYHWSHVGAPKHTDTIARGRLLERR
jgi:hypothetical protein